MSEGNIVLGNSNGLWSKGRMTPRHWDVGEAELRHQVQWRDAFWLLEVRQEEPGAEAERGSPRHLQEMFGDCLRLCQAAASTLLIFRTSSVYFKFVFVIVNVILPQG